MSTACCRVVGSGPVYRGLLVSELKEGGMGDEGRKALEYMNVNRIPLAAGLVVGIAAGLLLGVVF